MGEFDPFPRLRNVEIFPLPDENGSKRFALRDPQQISPHILSISADIAPALQFLDGSRSLNEIRSDFQKQVHQDIPMDFLRQFVEMLDQSYFLKSGTFQAYYANLVESFKKAEIRHAYHAGSSYARESVELVQSLTGFFSAQNGPGLPNKKVSDRIVPGIIAPHIDLRIGGTTYAWAYKDMAEAQRPDIVIVLGTGHSGVENLFTLTRKRFVTPLGEISVDKDFVQRLISLCSYDLFLGELSHRTEHTIEFQILFLQLLFGGRVPFVPILCSFDYSMVRSGMAEEHIQKFTDAVRIAIEQDGRRCCVVASADLAHVGPRYGDSSGFVGEDLDRIMEADRAMLTYVEKVDAEGFLDFISMEDDQRRICGLSPIYTMLKIIEAQKGTVLSHDYGKMDGIGSVCSFSSVVFEL